MHSAKSLFSSTFPQLWISLFSNTFIWWTLFKLIIIITRRWSERKGDPTKTKIWLCGRIKMNGRLHFSQCETNGAKKKKKKMNDMKNELTTLHWHSTSVEEKKKMLFSFFFFRREPSQKYLLFILAMVCLFWESHRPMLSCCKDFSHISICVFIRKIRISFDKLRTMANGQAWTEWKRPNMMWRRHDH